MAKIRQLASALLVYGTALIFMAACQSPASSPRTETTDGAATLRSASSAGLRAMPKAMRSPMMRALEICQNDLLVLPLHPTTFTLEGGEEATVIEDFHAEAGDSFESAYQNGSF